MSGKNCSNLRQQQGRQLQGSIQCKGVQGDTVERNRKKAAAGKEVRRKVATKHIILGAHGVAHVDYYLLVSNKR